MGKYNFSFFQVPSTGIDVEGPRSGPQSRSVTMRISSFGALDYGPRSSKDYTKTVYGFKSKDELQNPNILSFTQSADYKENPYVWGSTVKRIWNDTLRIMTLGSRFMSGAYQPKFDVSDTKLSWSTPKDGDVPLNYPTEGYTPFGGRVAGPFGYRVSK